MRYDGGDFHEINGETVRFADGKGLLVPGIEDNIVYSRASNEDNKSWVAELQMGFPDRHAEGDPAYIKDALTLYIGERLYRKEHDIAYHVYALGNPDNYWEIQSWYHSFDFDIKGDTILIVRTRSFLELYINNKKEKYSEYEGSVTGRAGLRAQLEDLYKYLDKKYFADDYDIYSLAYDKYIELLARVYLDNGDERDLETLKKEALTDKKHKDDADWEANDDPLKDWGRPRRESLNTKSMNKLFESVLRESASGLSDEDKDEILKIFRKNDIKVVDTSDEYEGGMYCFEVAAGNSNPTKIGYLHDDLYTLESRSICFDEEENDEGFYGRTFVFYYLDEDEE